MTLTGSLLLIDDDEDFAQILQRRFERCGMDVTVCLDQRAAIEAVQQCPFDAVLLDRSLGSFDGINLAREMKQFDATIQILMLSGYSDPELIEEAIGAGVDKYLVKPCPLHRLETAVEEALCRERAQRDGQGVLAGSTG